MSSVTINLTPSSSFKPFGFGIGIGNLIGFAGKKRIKGVVTNVYNGTPYEHTITLKSGYMAAPKSKLRKQTVFSKIKAPILNPL